MRCAMFVFSTFSDSVRHRATANAVDTKRNTKNLLQNAFYAHTHTLTYTQCERCIIICICCIASSKQQFEHRLCVCEAMAKRIFTRMCPPHFFPPCISHRRKFPHINPSPLPLSRPSPAPPLTRPAKMREIN